MPMPALFSDESQYIAGYHDGLKGANHSFTMNGPAYDEGYADGLADRSKHVFQTDRDAAILKAKDRWNETIEDKPF